MNKILLLLALSVSLFAVEPLKVGSSLSLLDNYEYETPKGRMMKIPAESTLLLFAFEKDTGALVNDYLRTKNQYYIQKHKAVFVADISKMPTVITNMFALPKMKKYKHLLYLHYGKEFRHLVPHLDDKITLIRFTDGKVTNISFATTRKEIQEAIER
ncbi:MAG: hypothetical protein Q9M43_13795 [Sulfurimonas sp.]|nr:hypothetical protein [Sulfurimonas sp.]